jgi:hypothetical protein
LRHDGDGHTTGPSDFSPNHNHDSSVMDAAQFSSENLELNGANLAANGAHFMFEAPGGGHDGALPAVSDQASPESPSDHTPAASQAINPPSPSLTAPRARLPHPTPRVPAAGPCTVAVCPAAGPSARTGGSESASTLPPIASTSVPTAAPGGSSAPYGSSALPAPSESVASPIEPAAPQRPATRLQHGIRKPKLYTDGTIRYANLVSTDESPSLRDALSDSRWKSAMEVEFSALMKNKTWHLVPTH